MFVWGKADDGQLGLGGIEDTFIPVARSEKIRVCTVEPSLSRRPRPKTNPSTDCFQYCARYTGSNIRAG